jgi:hypothetical protein
LQSVFRLHRDRPWLFLRNLGNWGDILLFKGAETLASRAGVEWRSYETPEFEQLEITPEHCIYLQGGGGFNEWSSGRAFVNLGLAAKSPAHLIVQGPMSTGGDVDWLRHRFAESLSHVQCGNIRMFARERHTMDTLERIGVSDQGVALHLDHDTALAFSRDDVLELAELTESSGSRYDLFVSREDPERPDVQSGTTSHSTNSSSTIVLDPAYDAVSFRHWLRIHLMARSITTNRLHSSILGCIAGLPVTLGPGSYHKNRSVWEFSLKDNGPAWSDRLAVPATHWQRLPERLRESYKLRQLRLWWHSVPLN